MPSTPKIEIWPNGLCAETKLRGKVVRVDLKSGRAFLFRDGETLNTTQVQIDAPEIMAREAHWYFAANGRA